MGSKYRKLIISYDFDFKVFGLRSTLKEFKLAWSINRILGIDLAKSEDLDIEIRKNHLCKISLFTFETDNSCITLAKNKLMDCPEQTTSYLLPELSHLDYILRIDGDTFPNTPEIIAQKLKALPTVEYLAAFDLGNIKSKENLLFY